MNWKNNFLVLVGLTPLLLIAQPEVPMGNQGDWLMELALDQNIAMFKKKSVLLEYFENEVMVESRRIDFIDSTEYTMYGITGQMVGYSQSFFFTRKGLEDGLTVKAERAKKNQSISYVDSEGLSTAGNGQKKDSIIDAAFTRVRNSGDTVEWQHGRIVSGKEVTDLCYGTIFKTITNPLFTDLEVGKEYSFTNSNKSKKEWRFSVKKVDAIFAACVLFRNKEEVIGYIETNKWGRITKIYDKNKKLRCNINQAY